MFRVISTLLLFLSINLFSLKINKGDYCLYSFQADGAYDAELKMEVTKIMDSEFALLITQRNGAITSKKEFKLPKTLNETNILDSFFKIMKMNSKNEINLKSKNIIDDYKFDYKSNKYTGFIIKANIEIDKEQYKVTYIFSEKLPLLGLFRFTITQNVKSKREYKFKNIMLIKECSIKGKTIKL
jgi:hypothetical protein